MRGTPSSRLVERGVPRLPLSATAAAAMVYVLLFCLLGIFLLAQWRFRVDGAPHQAYLLPLCRVLTGIDVLFMLLLAVDVIRVARRPAADRLGRFARPVLSVFALALIVAVQLAVQNLWTAAEGG